MKKNILWIMTDQHKATALSCLGKIKNMTPNIDALANDGVLFTDAYTPSPVCGPARASVKSGLFPAETGAVLNWVDFKPNLKFLPEILRENGYETGLVGKLHFFPPDKDYGFDYCQLSDAPYSVYADDDKYSKYIDWLRKEYYNSKGIDPVELFDIDEAAYDDDLKKFTMGSCFRTTEQHETAWTTERSIEFLKGRNKEKPFFLYTSYFGPHQPYGPPEEYYSWISPDEIELDESYYTDFKKNAPVFELDTRKHYNHYNSSLSEQDVKELIAAYYGQLKMIDDYIGKLITHLKEEGLYENTIIVFTSDHGDHLGEHGLFFKGQMYDSCAKVPLIIKDSCGKRKGERDSSVVNTLHLFATLLDYAQCDSSINRHHSISMKPLMESANCEWDNSTYSVIGANKNSLLCMLRQDDLKLIRLATGENEAVYEMYNPKEDPKEINDIWPNVKFEQVPQAMKTKLDNWFKEQYSKMS